METLLQQKNTSINVNKVIAWVVSKNWGNSKIGKSGWWKVKKCQVGPEQ